jgi:hypothetical protein
VRKLHFGAAVLVVFLFVAVGIAAAANPGMMGQPSQSCQNPATSTTPGNTVNAPGSPFGPNGVSGGVYANGPGTGGPGTATGTGHITNPTAVSQYDVACFQNSQPH